MNTRYLALWLPCLVILAMLANLLTPSPVLAAGEPPPPPGEKSPKAPAASNKPAPPSSAAAGSSYTVEIPVTAPVGAPDGAANAAAIALSVDAIAQAGAVLVGPGGRPLPLAARDTVDVLLVPDTVYFKGSGPALSECSGGWCTYDTITQALAAFTLRNGSGAIYASGALIEPAAVTVNGSTNLSKLTGLAWDGTTNYTPRLSGGLLSIVNMLKGFMVDGFFISQGISAHDNAGTLRFQNLFVSNPTDTGIDVYDHKGNIDLYNVTVVNANGNGARLDNTAGTGNVTVGNSTFNNNHNYGIYILTNGSALLDRVEASGNTNADGAHLVMVKGATVKDSRFDGNLNDSSGLTVNGTGAISLQNVQARLNTAYGVFLGTTNDITINGGSFFSNFANNGLKATSSGGNITLNNVIAISNATGVYLDNHLSASPKTVTVNNSQFVTNSGLAGLLIASKGNVTLNHIRAESNTSIGISIDNAQLDGVVYKGSGTVSILNTSGTNELIGNHITTLYIKSKNAITIKGVNAIGNTAGFWLDGCAIDKNPDPLATHYCLGKGNISITATSLAQTIVGTALTAGTGGAITLDGDTFLSNGGGVVLNNALVSSAKPVTVTNSAFSNSPAAAAIPLRVLSKGNITLNNVQALKNATTDMTIQLDNCIINVAACTGSGSISLLSSLGPNIILDNPATIASMSIASHGAVTLNGVVADYNKIGAKIDNSLGAGAVTISKSSFSHNTTGGGLYVNSAGKITLTSVNASSNNGAGGGGAMLSNASPGATTSATTTISKGVFDNNRGYGLVAFSWGSLTANNISASGNTVAGAEGARLGSYKGNVTLQNSLGPNQFNSNADNGLTVNSGVPVPTGTWGGTISLSGVTAYGNSNGYGIAIDNQFATTPKAVTIQKVRTEANGTDGLMVTSKGSVTLNNVQANFNINGWGVRIDNCLSPGLACAGNGNVSILSTLGPNSMSYNGTGMRLETHGSVVVNGLTASFNNNNYLNYSGVWINNQFPVATQKPVTVTQSNFDSNQGRGLTISATGLITLNGISASHNATIQGYGLYLDNAGVTGSPGVSILATLGNNQFNFNGARGIHIQSSGSIALNKVAANTNGFLTNQDGAYLQTSGASSISITCSAFNQNRWYGLFVNMGSGVLKFKGVAASDNLLGAGDFNFVSNPAGVTPDVTWAVCGK